MTRNEINNVLVKYVKMVKEQKPNLIPNDLSCYSLRHSKVMHLLESKVELIHIKTFLGHKSVTTTEMYARVNPKFTFKSIKSAYKNITTDEVPIWEGNYEILDMLGGAR